MNGPPKNESRQILPKSRNLAQPANGSRSLRFCVCRSHICFSIKSLNFSVSISDFKVPVSYHLPPLLQADSAYFQKSKCHEKVFLVLQILKMISKMFLAEHKVVLI